MWSASSKLLRTFSTGKIPLPPSHTPLGKLFAFISLGGLSFLGISFLDEEETNEEKQKILEIFNNKILESEKNSELILQSRSDATLKNNTESNYNKKSGDISQVVESLKHNEAEKIGDEEIKKRTEDIESKSEKKNHLNEKGEEGQVGLASEVTLSKEQSNEGKTEKIILTENS